MLTGSTYLVDNSIYQRTLNRGVKIVGGYTVNRIKRHGDKFLINERVTTKRIYSTIPLPKLIEILEHADLTHLRGSFDYNRVAVVAVALNRQAPRHHRVYVPDENVLFHRYAWISNYSPYNAPSGKSLLIAEVTIPAENNVPTGLTDKVVSDLIKLDVIRESDIAFVKMWVHEYGYPIHRTGFSKVRSEILGQLREHSIISLGRWGSWRYLNMDMVLKEVLTEFKADWGIEF